MRGRQLRRPARSERRKHDVDALTRLVEANNDQNRLTHAKKAKDQGKKVIGYLCSYVPQEIIHAAGMFPFRIMGTWKPDTLLADGYLTPNSCSFCRNCLEAVLNHEYDLLDGVVSTNSCRNMDRLFDTWEYLDKTPFTHMLDLPWRTNPDAQEYYIGGVQAFKEKLEGFFAIEIGDDALREAIELYNRSRTLQRELYELRKRDAPPISGAEALGVFTASMVMDREEYNELLEQLLAELKQTQTAHKGRARILYSGSILSDPEELRVIEEQGGLVVAEDLCTTSRFFWDFVDPSLDPLEALGKRYLDRLPCARMFEQDKRLEHVLDLAKEYHVDGVIYSAIVYCDPWSYAAPLSLLSLKKAGIPHLQLEREYGLTAEGQLRTRVGAFLEMLTSPSEVAVGDDS
jgi:bzd-type benzoyl-CoA reductase N subunit